MAHALLSASSAYRWLQCTAAPRLEERFEERTSEYAEEGTRAHELAERLITERKQREDYALGAMALDPAPEDQEMAEAVTSYADTVTETYINALKKDGGAQLYIEQRLDLSQYVPEGFGTADAVIISGGVLEVIDLKYGKGVRVDAEGNPQLRLYGLGALVEFGWLYDIHTVRMTIVQPRLDAISTAEMSVEDLTAWADEVAKVAQIAYSGEGEQVAGDHCRFCRVGGRCRAYAEYMQSKVDIDKDADTLTPLEVAQVLEDAGAIRSWLKTIEDMALADALNHGTQWPGFKLVRARGSRVITDEEAAANALKAAGVEDVYRLKTLTALEKLAGKKRFAEIAGEWITNKEGAPTLAPLSDKRSEYVPADDFNDDYTGGK